MVLKTIQIISWKTSVGHTFVVLCAIMMEEQKVVRSAFWLEKTKSDTRNKQDRQWLCEITIFKSMLSKVQKLLKSTSTFFVWLVPLTVLFKKPVVDWFSQSAVSVITNSFLSTQITSTVPFKIVFLFFFLLFIPRYHRICHFC